MTLLRPSVALAFLALCSTGARAQDRLLVTFDDPEAPFVDLSPGHHPLEPSGGVAWSSEASPAGPGGSARFDGTGAIRIPPSSDFLYAAGQDFTIDFWFRSPGSGRTGFPYAARMHAISFGTTGNLEVDFDDVDRTCGLWVYWSGVGLNAVRLPDGTMGAYTDDVWHHLAIVRASGNVNVYVDGRSIGAAFSAPEIGSATEDNYLGRVNPGVVGVPPDFPPMSWVGWLDNVRVSGAALWTTEFTPPTCANGGYPGACGLGATCDPAADWKSHGEYVSCVARASAELVRQGKLTQAQRTVVVTAAARSSIGR